MSRSDESPNISNVLFALVTGLLLTLVLGLTAKQLYLLCQERQVEYQAKMQEMREARQVNVELEQRNRQLRALVRHLETEEGVEEIARNKLGLVKPGEMAFVVSPAPPTRTIYETSLPEPEVEAEPGWMERILDKLFAVEGQPSAD